MSAADIAGVRLWLTADDSVVLDGDPGATILLCAEGDEIPEGYSAPKAARKQADKVEDKAIAGPDEDKAVSKRSTKSKD